MSFSIWRFASITGLILILSGCFHPPYNHFKKDMPVFRDTAKAAIPGALIGTALGSAGTGAIVGASAGAILSLSKDTPQGIIKQLAEHSIQYVEYGDRRTLIVPTDKYFYINSAKLNDSRYEGLYLIIKLLWVFPKSSIFVAGFTDNIGTNEHKYKLSRAQAEAMVGYLWAFNIPSHQIRGQGLADKFDIGDNKIIHGSAYNRRLEIQWSTSPALMHP